MSKATIFCVVIFIFLCVSSGFAGTFIDDFSNPAETKAMWEVIHRDWVIKDGYYWSPGKAGLTQDPITLLPIEVEDGMVIEAQCGDKGDGEWSNFGVVYAYEDEDLVWAVGAGVGNDQWRIFQFTSISSKGGAWGSDAVAGVPVKKLLEPNKWYNIRIEIKGKEISLFASSEPEGKNLNEENSYVMDKAPKGRIGLGAAGASPMFNEIKVTGKSVKAVKPANKLAMTWGKIRIGLSKQRRQ